MPNPRHALLSVLLAALFLFTLPDSLSASGCPANDGATVLSPVLNYPLMSPNYAVQYRVGAGPWTQATTYISVYGATLASPYRGDSGYSQNEQTSLSFVNIPAQAGALVQLRVTKLFGTPFTPADHVTVRPTVFPAEVDTLPGGEVQISTVTAAAFAGEQFILWWERGSDNAGIEGLAFFLNPPYAAPASSVKVVRTDADLDDVSAVTALDIEGSFTIAHTQGEYEVPPNILTIYIAQDVWVKGKLRFSADTDPAGHTRTLYGPGVLDGSLFDYKQRACGGAEGDYTLTTDAANGVLNYFTIDGIMLTDTNHAATKILFHSTLNNMKTLGWNAENAALRLGNNTTASNLFIRSGDDSLMIWGEPVAVTNATVWQNYNGGVVNLGWSNTGTGQGTTLDGLHVVKTDWTQPTGLYWTSTAPDQLDNQNNAVFASLMTPGTSYGGKPPTPVFRNIFVEDPPNVLFSLKILPPICADTGLTCPMFQYTGSTVALSIENLFSPQSKADNSIGFQILQSGFTQDSIEVPTTAPLPGTMAVNFTNVFLQGRFGLWLPLTSFDAGSLGKISTRGNVNLTYNLGLP